MPTSSLGGDMPPHMQRWPVPRPTWDCRCPATTQLLPPGELHGARDGWAQEQAKKIFAPLHAMTLPLSSAAFQTGMDQLHSDLAAQHAICEAQELAQHANWEAHEDHCDATQTFKG